MSKNSISHYAVYGSESSEFDVDNETLLAKTADPCFTHHIAPESQTWHHLVAAVNEYGNAGLASEVVTVTTEESVVLDGRQIASIGEFNSKSIELALAPNGYAEYPSHFADGVGFTHDVHDPGTGWPYLHSGPADTWAGNRLHQFIFCFDLDEVLNDDFVFAMWLIDTHGSNPGTLIFGLNDDTVGAADLPPGAMRGSLEGNTTVERSLLRACTSSYRFRGIAY